MISRNVEVDKLSKEKEYNFFSNILTFLNLFVFLQRGYYDYFIGRS